MRLPLIYIAGPFRGPTPWDVKQHVMAAETVGLEVARMGGYPVIPHCMTQSFDKQLTDEFWLEGTRALLLACDACVLMPTWQTSIGAKAEREAAERAGMSIFYWADRGDQLTFMAWIERWQRRHEAVI